jgi:hypothetical protein
MPAPHIKTYKKVLLNFLSYRDGTTYNNDHSFDLATLGSITAEDVCRWLRYKAYGSPEPDEDHLPGFARSTTLHFHKKAISYFIPNKHMAYNVETLTGNPTRAPEVNDLIKAVKKHEVRAEGVPSQARREFTIEEFREIIRIAEKDDSFEVKVRLPTVCKLQFHLIARVDDTAHLLCNELKIHPQFDFALLVRLRWTKNCLEERDAPDQFLLGAMDSDFCVLIALGIYFQYVLEFTNAVHSDYFFCNSEETPDSVK